MKILTFHKSAFERQIREAVLLDFYAGPLILNSKLEYTRCSLPRIEMKIGNKETQEDKYVTKEKAIVKRIKMIYKGENKRPKVDDDEEEKIDDKKDDDDEDCHEPGKKKTRVEAEIDPTIEGGEGG